MLSSSTAGTLLPLSVGHSQCVAQVGPHREHSDLQGGGGTQTCNWTGVGHTAHHWTLHIPASYTSISVSVRTDGCIKSMAVLEGCTWNDYLTIDPLRNCALNFAYLACSLLLAKGALLYRHKPFLYPFQHLGSSERTQHLQCRVIQMY